MKIFFLLDHRLIFMPVCNSHIHLSIQFMRCPTDNVQINCLHNTILTITYEGGVEKQIKQK